VSADLALIGGATIGMAVGGLLIPTTRRELAAAMARAGDGIAVPRPTVMPWHRLALVVASGLVPGIVLSRVGWSYVALPPLLLFLSLVQLAYCDMRRRLLPRSMVHATMLCVTVSAIVAAPMTNDWRRLEIALLCSAGLTALLFVVNLMNPAWMAFGDVRLAPALGLGLAWISPMALLEGFFLANLLAAVVGIIMMIARTGGRKSALPFGFYLALATGVVILFWS
jgi:leader peptidase (prepilin peptidase) / N-methyltransferase